jgi:hypothetical protein
MPVAIKPLVLFATSFAKLEINAGGFDLNESFTLGAISNCALSRHISAIVTQFLSRGSSISLLTFPTSCRASSNNLIISWLIMGRNYKLQVTLASQFQKGQYG